ncbi:MAG: SDR family oxidoreductase [Bacteroidales bacterium]|nr:SDR family oxidoreductase [Bacteroidales bacterium]
MNPFSLNGKTILVTGASSGIGRGVAISCAQMGATLILNGRNEARLQETLQMLEGDGHSIIVADLATQEGIDHLADALPEIQGWVNSAGIPKVSPIKYFTREDVEEILNVNAVSSMLLLSKLLKKKKLKRGASVVFISAVTGAFVGSKGDTSYCASKGAVNGFMKGAALELAPQGIRVNSINPGLVPTNILNLANELAGEEHHTEIMLERYPLNRLGTPEDIGNGAVYLLSDASAWVTGTNLVIDGGYLLN